MSRKKKKAGKAAGSAPSAIDPRTEQVLRQALDPASVATAQSPTPAPAGVSAGMAAVQAPLKPATPDRSRLDPPPDTVTGPVAQPSQVTVAGSHYHPSPEPAPPPAPAQPAPRIPKGLTPATLDNLREVLKELPIKAGEGDMAKQLAQVGMAALRYYQFGISQPGSGALPLAASDAGGSMQEDAAVVAGYLQLEKRFGRLDDKVDPATAAKGLLWAVASHALTANEKTPTSDEDAVRNAVAGCLQVPAGSVPAPSTTGGDAAQPAGVMSRIVYRRRSGA